MKIYFEIKTQFSNLGDALINSCLIKTLSQKAQLCVCVDGVPKNFIDKLNIPNNVIIFESKKNFYINMISNKEKKILFMNPGGEAGELSMFQFIKKVLGLSRYILLKISGVSLIRIGVSYNDLGKLHTIYLKTLSKLISRHFVRDQISFNELKKYNISINGIIPDLAFLLEHKKRNFIPNKFALVSLRKYEHTSNLEVFNYLENFIKQNNWDWSFQVEADEFYIKDIINANNKTMNLINLTKSINNTKEFYSQYEFVITNRLHVLLLAASVGCKTIALLEKGKNKKIEGILKDLKLDEFIYYVDEKNQKNLSELAFTNNSIENIYLEMNNLIENNISKILSEV